MKDINKRIILLVLFIIFAIFYWIQVRPSLIKKHCSSAMTSSEYSYLIITGNSERERLGWDMNKINDIEREKENFYYQQCLHSKGL